MIYLHSLLYNIIIIYRLIFFLLLGFRDAMNMKLYDASRDGKIDQVDLAMQEGADVHWKNPDEDGK